MMKIQQLKHMCFSLLMIVSVSSAFAQETTTIVMDPAMFDPADTGYFVAGIMKDLNNDGEPEFYNGCFDAYGDADHREDGIQNGWAYENVIIFRGCDIAGVDNTIKGDIPTENWPTVGNLIQVTKHKFAYQDTVTNSFGYIQSPSFSNIQSLNVKVGTDVSINDSRQIILMVEASTDGGDTWHWVDATGDAYIYQPLADQGGEDLTYTEGTDDGFDAIAAASEAGPIMLRFLPVPPTGANTSTTNGERLKFWKITIEAEVSSGALSADLKTADPFKIRNSTFISNTDEPLFIYNLSGTLLGKGQRVEMPCNGLYLVKTAAGSTSKIYLK